MGRKAKEERLGALRADVAALTEEIRGARKASEATAQMAADHSQGWKGSSGSSKEEPVEALKKCGHAQVSGVRCQVTRRAKPRRRPTRRGASRESAGAAETAALLMDAGEPEAEGSPVFAPEAVEACVSVFREKGFSSMERRGGTRGGCSRCRRSC